MAKKDEILHLYYEEKMKCKIISNKMNVSTAYITKVIKCDVRYLDEKNRRKKESAIKQKERNIECIRKNRIKQRNLRLDGIMEMQHIQASMELSGRKTINNRAYRNWNSSIYEYHKRTREYRVKEGMKDKVSYAVPKKIKWD